MFQVINSFLQLLSRRFSDFNWQKLLCKMNTSHLVGSVYLVGSYILNFIMKFMICLPTCSLHFTLSLIKINACCWQIIWKMQTVCTKFKVCLLHPLLAQADWIRYLDYYDPPGNGISTIPPTALNTRDLSLKFHEAEKTQSHL